MKDLWFDSKWMLCKPIAKMINCKQSNGKESFVIAYSFWAFKVCTITSIRRELRVLSKKFEYGLWSKEQVFIGYY